MEKLRERPPPKADGEDKDEERPTEDDESTLVATTPKAVSQLA